MAIRWGDVIEILECEQTWDDNLDIVSVDFERKENERTRLSGKTGI